MKYDPQIDETEVTGDDLPRLRANLTEYAGCEFHSDGFRQVCREAVAAIDQARDEDEATHAFLQTALEKFVAAARLELLRFPSCGS